LVQIWVIFKLNDLFSAAQSPYLTTVGRPAGKLKKAIRYLERANYKKKLGDMALILNSCEYPCDVSEAMFENR
jgi:hypothetical protein